MILPTDKQKKSILISLRPRFIPMVNGDKTEWEELTPKEKKAVERLCERYFGGMVF